MNNCSSFTLHEKIRNTHERLGRPMPAGFYPLAPEEEGSLRMTMGDRSPIHPALTERADFQRGIEKGKSVLDVIAAAASLGELSTRWEELGDE